MEFFDIGQHLCALPGIFTELLVNYSQYMIKSPKTFSGRLHLIIKKTEQLARVNIINSSQKEKENRSWIKFSPRLADEIQYTVL